MPVMQSPVKQVRIPKTRVVGWVAFSMLAIIAAAVGAAAGLLLVFSTDLPQVQELERYRPSATTELYDVKGRVVGSFALQRRVVARYEDFPKLLRDAVLSTEDKDFESHVGINFWRVIGAAYHDIRSGGKAQGASTLTMQLARNLFLSADKFYIRKLQEVMLSIQIERYFTKPQIFTMYANQIYLGHGVYGFEAGAEYYFDKHASDLTLSQAALLAGLPQAPNAYSPVLHPDRALRRRNIVINNMLEDGKITVAQAGAAKAEPIKLDVQSAPNALAPYFIEEVRKYLEKKYGPEEVHEGALRVYTGLDMDLQKVANRAVLDGLAALERRHGWKPVHENILDQGFLYPQYSHADWNMPIEAGDYVHAVVRSYSSVTHELVADFGKYQARLGPEQIKWALAAPEFHLRRGDLIYLKITALGKETTLDSSRPASALLEQDSGVQGALMLVENATGNIKALVGGRDFNDSRFDRAVQAERQVGSSFKPYVYTTALLQGMKPDDIIVDAPVTFPSASGPYSPHNYDNKYLGAIPLWRALAESRNVPAIKVAARVGIKNVIETARKFGVTSPLPPVLPLALGAAELTLQEQVSSFTVFPNDGIRVAPRFITKVTDAEGHTLEEDFPQVHDVIPPDTARTMVQLMQGVVQHGTARAALALNHPLAGKTGTTNDFTDAWFVGYSPSLTCGVWVGYDTKIPLGPKETGGEAALPIWMDVMKVALAAHPNERFTGQGNESKVHEARKQ
jgi:penicillin-binding protein 1A